MSRSSAVRDDVIEEMRLHIADILIESFIVPSYTREELTSGPRIGVRYGSRELQVDQGPDERNITIEVCVVGVTPPNESSDEAAYRVAQVAACDGFDSLMESVIALWTPNGVLARRAMADHRFVSITQAIQFDANKLYADSIWLSMVSLEYQDCSDE